MEIVGDYHRDGYARVKGLIPPEIGQVFLQTVKRGFGDKPIPLSQVLNLEFPSEGRGPATWPFETGSRPRRETVQWKQHNTRTLRAALSRWAAGARSSAANQRRLQYPHLDQLLDQLAQRADSLVRKAREQFLERDQGPRQ